MSNEDGDVLSDKMDNRQVPSLSQSRYEFIMRIKISINAQMGRREQKCRASFVFSKCAMISFATLTQTQSVLTPLSAKSRGV